MIESKYKENKNYKIKVKYGNKETKKMILTGEQIHNKLRQNKKSKYKPYITFPTITKEA